jgi:hypothetical protein
MIGLHKPFITGRIRKSPVSKKYETKAVQKKKQNYQIDLKIKKTVYSGRKKDAGKRKQHLL